MYEIVTEIEINAACHAVWRVLMDFVHHPEWNPFVRRISGEAKVGNRLEVSICPPGGKGMTFRPKVLAVQANAELRWLGHLMVPGLFDGEHYFVLHPLAADRARLVHGERFSGLLVPLLKSQLESGTRAGFTAMNEALKLRVENHSATTSHS